MAVCLRDRARAALIASGGRGFMRFAQTGDALLITDAIRRCKHDDEKMRMKAALHAAGFACLEEENLLYLMPEDALIDALGEEAPQADVNWTSDLHPLMALAARLSAQPELTLTPDGRRLVIETLRLTGQPGADVMKELDSLRAQAAVMLRRGDRSGMRTAGRILWDWCQKEERR